MRQDTLMMKEKIVLVPKDPAVQELIAEFPNTAPEAIESMFKFLKVATYMNIKRESLFIEYGLTLGRFNLLLLLKQEKSKSLSPSELAKRTSVSRGTMTQFLDALEKDGFAERVADPHDKRSMLVQLTPKAEETIRRILPNYLKRMEQFISVLNPEEQKLWLTINEKMVNGLKEFDD